MADHPDTTRREFGDAVDMAQRPSGDVRDTAWRHSLMNWGHDPLER